MEEEIARAQGPGAAAHRLRIIPPHRRSIRGVILYATWKRYEDGSETVAGAIHDVQSM